MPDDTAGGVVFQKCCTGMPRNAPDSLKTRFRRATLDDCPHEVTRRPFPVRELEGFSGPDLNGENLFERHTQHGRNRHGRGQHRGILAGLNTFQLLLRHDPHPPRKILLRQPTLGQQRPNPIRLHLARHHFNIPHDMTEANTSCQTRRLVRSTTAPFFISVADDGCGSGSASPASMSWLTWRNKVKWCRACADMARPRPSMPGNRTATFPNRPQRLCAGHRQPPSWKPPWSSSRATGRTVCGCSIC